MSNLIWLPIVKDSNGEILKMTHQEAVDYAKSIDARLPEIYELLEAYIKKDIEFENQWFWSSSINAYLNYPFFLSGYSGLVSYSNRDNKVFVICVKDEVDTAPEFSTGDGTYTFKIPDLGRNLNNKEVYGHQSKILCNPPKDQIVTNQANGNTFRVCKKCKQEI